jgi:hypothetical protein
MKYAQHFMGQAFHGAGKPGNDGTGYWIPDQDPHLASP